MAKRHSVGLHLETEYHERLLAYATARHWSLSTAARVIIMERLDAELAEQAEQAS